MTQIFGYAGRWATHDPAAAEFATDLYQLRDGQIAAREQRSATIAG